METNVNNRFKEFRIHIGIKAEDLASGLGKVKGRIYDIERGDSDPHLKEVIYLSENYNLNPTWLLTGKGDMLLKTSTEVIDEKGVPAVLEKVRKLLDSQDHYLVDELKAEFERFEELESETQRFVTELEEGLKTRNLLKLLFSSSKKT